MRLRRCRSQVIAALALAAGLPAGGCVPDPEPPLRVGMAVWTGYAPAYLAWPRGWLGDTARVSIVDFDSPETARAAFRDGSVDAMAATLDYALQVAEQRPTTRIVMVFGVSNGGDAVLGRPGMTSVRDLRGARVAVQSGTLGFYMLRRALDAAGLDMEDVTVVPTDPGEQESRFAGDSVDAVVTFEPTRSRLIARGAVPLFSSADIPGEIVDVLVADSATLADRRAELDRYVDGWYQGRAELLARPEDAARVLAGRLGLTPAQIRDALALTTFPDREAARRLLDGTDPALRQAEARVTALLRDAGLMRRAPAPARVNDPRLLARSGASDAP